MADEFALRAERLLALWSDLSMRHVALSGACACGTGGISLRLDDFELDIVGYLEDAAQRSGVPALAAFFGDLQRAEARSQPLRQLLEDVGEGRLPQEVADWLLPKIEKTLRSFAELHGPRGGE